MITSVPHPPIVNFDTIPPELRTLQQWVLWRYQRVEGRRDWTKVPLQASGYGASTTAPETWGTFEDVQSAYMDSRSSSRPFAGVGLVLASDAGLLGIDLDGCRGAEGVRPWARTVLDIFGPTYTEISPSGTGLRAFVRGSIPEGARNRVSLEGHVDSVPGDKRPELEWYTEGRYLTLTGMVFEGATTVIAEPPPEALAEVWDYVCSLADKKQKPATKPTHTDARPVALSDDALLDKARHAGNGARFKALYDHGDVSTYGGDVSAATAALLFRLAFWTNKDAGRMDSLFRGSALMRPKWDEPRGTSTWGALEIASAIAKVSDTYTPPSDYEGVAHLLPWQPFPVGVLPRAAADYIRAQAAAIGCDEATVAPLVLGVLACAVGNSHRIALKRSWTEHAALWLAVVARSGEHKSPALYAALLPVYQREKKAAEEHEAAREQYEKNLADYNALDKTVKDKTEKPVPPVATRYRTGDATVEALAYLHNDNPRGLTVVRDELAGLFGAFDKYTGGSSDMQSWIEIADGRPVVIDRKTGDRKTLRIDSPCVPIIGGTQPGILRDKLKPPFFDSGFAPRFLFVAPPSVLARFTDADVEVGVWQRYDDLIGGLYGRPHGGEPIPLSAEAWRLFKGFYDASHAANAKVSSDRLRAAFVKHVGFCARFALILHLADTPPRQEPQPITANAMQRAVRLALWFRHETARLYHKFGFIKSEGAGRDETLVRRLSASFTWKDVSDVWGVGKSQAYEIIKRLIRDGLAEDAGRGSYSNRTSDLPDFEGIEVEVEGVSPISPVIPVSGGNGIDPDESVATVWFWDKE